MIFKYLILIITAFFIHSDAKVEYTVVPLSVDASDLGDGTFWDDQWQLLWYVDINENDACVMDVDSGYRECAHLNQFVSNVIPYVNGEDFLVTVGNKLGKLHWPTKVWTKLAEIEPEIHGKNLRFNDGKIDAKGRLWIGTITYEKGDHGDTIPESGNLYKYFNGEFIKMSGGFNLTNDMIWSNDNRKLYVNDSDGRKIYVFDFDLNNGTVSNKKVYIDLDKNAGFGKYEYPDGITIDQYGNLWAALYNGSGVVKMDPITGEVEDRIHIPCPLTTSSIFGGENFDQLYVTTAYKNFGPDLRTKYPNCGKVFRITADAVTLRGAGPGYRFNPQSQ